MRNLWRKAFAAGLYFILAHVSPIQTELSPACTVCNGFQICGIRRSVMPLCINALPCTKKQYHLCIEIAEASQSDKCDRPGIFPDFKSPDKFFTCRANDSAVMPEKNELTCPRNTTFDPLTMRCLTKDEKNVLQAAEQYVFGLNGSGKKFNCENAGTFPDPDNCKIYHVCDSQMQSQDFYCPVGTYFNDKNCESVKTKKCIKQLEKQYELQKIQGEAIYRRVEYLLAQNKTISYQSSVNSSGVTFPNVIKTTFRDSKSVMHTIYAATTNSIDVFSSPSGNSQQNFINMVEKVVEQTLNEAKNTDEHLPILRTLLKNVTDVSIENEHILTTKLGHKVCKNILKPLNAGQLKDKVIINKVVVIIIKNDTFEKNTIKPPDCPSTTLSSTAPITTPMATDPEISSFSPLSTHSYINKTTTEHPETANPPLNITSTPKTSTTESPEITTFSFIPTSDRDISTHEPPVTDIPFFWTFKPKITAYEPPSTVIPSLTTTSAPKISTHKPPVTVISPLTTTSTPKTSTHEPPVTVISPLTTTSTPKTSTHEPPVTDIPFFWTFKPKITAYEPPSTVISPLTTTSTPKTSTHEPPVTVISPLTTTSTPKTSTHEPPVTDTPFFWTFKPKSTAYKPPSTVIPSLTTTSTPKTSTHEPPVTVISPLTTTSTPKTSTHEPPVTDIPFFWTFKPKITAYEPPSTVIPSLTTTSAPKTSTHEPPVTDIPFFWTFKPKITAYEPPSTVIPSLTTTSAPKTSTHEPPVTVIPSLTTTSAPKTSTHEPPVTVIPSLTTTSTPKTSTHEPPVTVNPSLTNNSIPGSPDITTFSFLTTISTTEISTTEPPTTSDFPFTTNEPPETTKSFVTTTSTTEISTTEPPETTYSLSTLTLVPITSTLEPLETTDLFLTTTSTRKISTTEPSNFNTTLWTTGFLPNTTTTTYHPSISTKPREKFRCRYPGFFRDPEDCHSFYRCRRVGIRKINCTNCKSKPWELIVSRHTCKNGKWFSNFFWACVRSRPLEC